MGRELSEGKVHALERQVALAKGFVDDMRKGYVELEDHCAALDEEAEDLQRQACIPSQSLQLGSDGGSAT